MKDLKNIFYNWSETGRNIEVRTRTWREPHRNTIILNLSGSYSHLILCFSNKTNGKFQIPLLLNGLFEIVV